jgi:hypothetical protein
MSQILKQRTRSREAPTTEEFLPLKIFIFLWSLAIFLNSIFDFPEQVFRRPPWEPNSQFLLPLLTFLALACLWRQRWRRFMVLIVLDILIYMYRAPNPGNHDLLAFFVEIAFVGAVILTAIRYREIRAENIFATFAPAGRWFVLALYSLTVLHKLNFDYLDIQVSCGSRFLDFLRGRIFFFLPPPSDSIRQFGIIVSLLIESAIPFALVSQRFVAIGVLIGVIFHSLLGYLFFWHFSPFVFALYFLYLPTKVEYWIGDKVQFGRAVFGLTFVLPLIVVFEMISHAGGWPQKSVFIPAFNFMAILGWLIFAVLSYFALYFSVQIAFERRPEVSRPLRFTVSWLAVLPLLMVIVGLFPYLGLSSLLSFSMFSSLRTEGGQSNHLIIPPSVQVSPNLSDLVQMNHLPWSLAKYLPKRDRPTMRPFLYPWLGLRKLVDLARLEGETNISLAFTKDKVFHSISNAELDPLFAPAPTLLERKLLKFRFIHPNRSLDCAY